MRACLITAFNSSLLFVSESSDSACQCKRANTYKRDRDERKANITCLFQEIESLWCFCVWGLVRMDDCKSSNVRWRDGWEKGVRSWSTKQILNHCFVKRIRRCRKSSSGR